VYLRPSPRLHPQPPAPVLSPPTPRRQPLQGWSRAARCVLFQLAFQRRCSPHARRQACSNRACQMSRRLAPNATALALAGILIALRSMSMRPVADHEPGRPWDVDSDVLTTSPLKLEQIQIMAARHEL